MAGDQGSAAPAQGMTASWVAYAAILIVGLLSLFSLYMGSWGALKGVERLGATAFPFGAGAPGMTSRAVQWLGLMRPQAFYGTPSYALHLAEVARAEEQVEDLTPPELVALVDHLATLAGEYFASIAALGGAGYKLDVPREAVRWAGDREPA